MKLQTLKKGFTLIEIMVVIAIIAALASMGTVGAMKVKKKGAELSGRAFMIGVVTAVEEFHSHYGYLPEGAEEGVSFSGIKDNTSDSLNAGDGVYYTDASFMAALIGLDEDQNPDNRVFYNGNDYKKGKGGMLYENNSKDAKAVLLDPWGNPYVVRLDVNQEGSMPGFNPPAGGGIANSVDDLQLIRGKNVIVMSFGDDGYNNPKKPPLNKDNKGNLYSY